MTIDEMKQWIDNASYEELLRKWRFASAGDPFFRSDTGVGEYYAQRMAEKKAEIGPAGAVAASKAIGW